MHYVIFSYLLSPRLLETRNCYFSPRSISDLPIMLRFFQHGCFYEKSDVCSPPSSLFHSFDHNLTSRMPATSFPSGSICKITRMFLLLSTHTRNYCVTVPALPVPSSDILRVSHNYIDLLLPPHVPFPPLQKTQTTQKSLPPSSITKKGHIHSHHTKCLNSPP